MGSANSNVFALFEADGSVIQLCGIGDVSNSDWKMLEAGPDLRALPTSPNDNVINLPLMIIDDPH
jgi:hypothetical protein